MSGFNIQNFSKQIGKNGLLRNNKFLLNFSPPRILLNDRTYKNDVIKNIEFWCESLSLPGVSLSTSEVRRYGYGVMEKKPFVAAFNDINFTFYCDSNSNLLLYFQRWMKLISNYDTFQGITGTNTGVVNNHLPYELSYKDDYTTTLAITVHKDSGEKSIKINCQHAFPISIGEIPLSWNDSVTLLRVPVVMTYMDWYEDRQIKNGF